MCALDLQTAEYLLRNEYKDALEFNNVLAPLIDFSLISVTEDGQNFQIHRLVRIAMAMWLEKHNLTAKYREEAHGLLLRHFSEEDDLEPKTNAVFRQDLSHILSDEPEGPLASETIETASIMSIEAPSLVSDTTLPSSVPVEDAAQEFASLLFHDEVLQPLLFEAQTRVDNGKLKRNFAKLLVMYAGDLQEEAAEILENAAVDLVRKRIQYITSCVWDFLDPPRTANLKRWTSSWSKHQNERTVSNNTFRI